MKIVMTRWFGRWARSEGILDAALCAAVEAMRQGLFDADLGAGLFKKRVARRGRGKSGGFRTLVVTNKEDRWFFVYGFAKNARANIDNDEEAALKKLAKELLSYSATAVSKAEEAKLLLKVHCHAQDQIPHSRCRP